MLALQQKNPKLSSLSQRDDDLKLISEPYSIEDLHYLYMPTFSQIFFEEKYVYV